MYYDYIFIMYTVFFFLLLFCCLLEQSEATLHKIITAHLFIYKSSPISPKWHGHVLISWVEMRGILALNQACPLWTDKLSIFATGDMRCGTGHLPGACQRTMGLHCILILWLFSGWAVGYKQGDNVTLYVNKVGPYHNPQETYHYYTLPVCRPEKVSLCSVSLSVIGLL